MLCGITLCLERNFKEAISNGFAFQNSFANQE